MTSNNSDKPRDDADDREITPAHLHVREWDEDAPGWVDSQGFPELKVNLALLGHRNPMPSTGDPEKDALFADPKYAAKLAEAERLRKEREKNPLPTVEERRQEWAARRKKDSS